MSVDVVGGATWRSPVLVRIGYGSSEAVESPQDALHYLNYRWPHERGPLYVRALNICKTASEGLVPVEVAKEAFISAALEARLLDHHSRN